MSYRAASNNYLINVLALLTGRRPRTDPETTGGIISTYKMDGYHKMFNENGAKCQSQAPRAEGDVLKCLFVPTNSPKPKYLQFIMI